MTVPDDDSLPDWVKSSYSETDNCVEVRRGKTKVAVRDSKDPDGGVIELPVSAWRGVLASVRTPQ